jgi:hypothetical protein
MLVVVRRDVKPSETEEDFNFTMSRLSGIMLNVMAAFSKVFWPLPA